MPVTFSNQFGGHASEYARFRPTSPRALCRWIAEQAPSTSRLLDCGTGNGQAAVKLAEFFDRVDGVDASPEQIAIAKSRGNVHYQVSLAESLPFADHSMDVVTCATALHWFDRQAFFSEVERVLKPGGLVAIWSYARSRTVEAVEEVISELADDVIYDYWDPRVKNHALTYELQLPVTEMKVPEFEIKRFWSVDDLLGYLSTWSAYRNFVRENGHEPMPELRERLEAVWGSGSHRHFSWKLLLRAGRFPIS